MNTQISLPVAIDIERIKSRKTFGKSIELCADFGGFEMDKTLTSECGFDKAQFSRWTAGTEGVNWPKLEVLMDVCGNDAPLLWMLSARGYDLTSIRKLESETEKLLRIEREKGHELERENKIMKSLLMGKC
ncbi:MAG: hypothetical protein V4536_08670 [Pseudomonadota bacterium]